MDNNKAQVINKEHFAEALNDMLKTVDNGFAGMSAVMDVDREAKSLIFGDDNAIEVLLMNLIIYAAEKEKVDIFNKILNMQLRLAQVYPEEYQQYAESVREMGKQYDG